MGDRALRHSRMDKRPIWFIWTKGICRIPIEGIVKRIGGTVVILNLTAREIMNLSLWEEYCEASGMSVYAVNEGMNDNEPLDIPESLYTKIILALARSRGTIERY